LPEAYCTTDWNQVGISPNDILNRITDEALVEVGRKFFAGSRLGLAEGWLFGTPDLVGLGLWLQLPDEPGSVIEHSTWPTITSTTQHLRQWCKFCAFHRSQGSPEGYLLKPESCCPDNPGLGLRG
jgi:hypothetical protein